VVGGIKAHCEPKLCTANVHIRLHGVAARTRPVNRFPSPPKSFETLRSVHFAVGFYVSRMSLQRG
jgi:hypothetical protein